MFQLWNQLWQLSQLLRTTLSLKKQNTFLGFSRFIIVDLPELSRPTMIILDFFLPMEPPINLNN